MEKRSVAIICLLIMGILSISFVSAGFLDDIKKTITGKPTSPVPQDIAITVAGTNSPVFEVIDAIPDAGPLEADIRIITFGVQISDADSVDDIDDSSITLKFTNIGETDIDGSCSWVSDDIPSKTATYSCSVNMQYYYKADDWIVELEITDFGPGTPVQDVSTTFKYEQLAAMDNSDPSLTWPSLAPEAANQLANENPTTITNTGNYDGDLSILAYDLIGTDLTPFPATAFSIGETTGGGPPPAECNVGVTAVQMGDGATNSVATTSKGPASTNDLYYCITTVPGVPSQAYTTTGASWSIIYGP